MRCIHSADLQSVEQPVYLPVHAAALAPDLLLVGVERVPALLAEADGEHEADDGGELVQLQVEPVRQQGQ